MANSKEYLERNKEAINRQRRENYQSEVRRDKYRANREQILQKLRDDRAMCPLCSIEYRRLYLKRHLMGRHGLESSSVDELLT